MKWITYLLPMARLCQRGGSVPYTYTIYANAFRVAEHIKQCWQINAS